MPAKKLPIIERLKLEKKSANTTKRYITEKVASEFIKEKLKFKGDTLEHKLYNNKKIALKWRDHFFREMVRAMEEQNIKIDYDRKNAISDKIKEMYIHFQDMESNDLHYLIGYKGSVPQKYTQKIQAAYTSELIKIIKNGFETKKFQETMNLINSFNTEFEKSLIDALKINARHIKKE